MVDCDVQAADLAVVETRSQSMRKHLNTFSAVLFLCSGFMQALMGHVPAAVSAFAAGMLFMGLAISKAGKRRKEEDDDNNKDKK